MAKKSFAAVVIENKNRYYKLHTIALSKDGSLHFIDGFNQHFRRTGQENLIPSKGTYHKSGVKHFTQGSGEDRGELFRKVDGAHADVGDTQGLETFTIKDVANKCADTLDPFSKFNGYEHLVELSSANYTILTVKYWLASKDFDTSKSAHLYDEVHEIYFMDRKLIIATNNSTNTDELMQILL
jgi:hypothetical protein